MGLINMSNTKKIFKNKIFLTIIVSLIWFIVYYGKSWFYDIKFLVISLFVIFVTVMIAPTLFDYFMIEEVKS